MYDLLIIGSGPAGVSAALSAKARNLDFLWFGSRSLSGKIEKAERIMNYPGLPAVSGGEMRDAFLRQIDGLGISVLEERVNSIYDMGGYYAALVNEKMYEGRAVILATGVSGSREIPGESRLLGRGVSYCATCDGMLYRGKRVAVLGWTPSAEKEAAFLEGIGCQVLYLDKPRDCAIRGAEKVEAVTCGGVTEAVEAVFLLRPAMAPGDLFPGLETGGGFVAVDREMRTNLPGVFAAGDCTGGPLQVSKAVGEGLTAGQKAAAFAAAVK